MNDVTHKAICSWCSKIIREGDEPVSHGMCEDCAVKVFKELYSPKSSGVAKDRKGDITKPQCRE